MTSGNSLFLGADRDAEADGQPSSDASGDGADEDGVTVGALNVGTAADVTVTSSDGGFLNAWIDFNQDGDGDDPGEQVFDDVAVVAGANNLQITAPVGTAIGSTFARFRLTERAGYSDFGLAASGEVEDYQLEITDPPVDFGDAPEAGTSYPTTLANNGARHVVTGNTLYLGASRDAELDGQPNADEDGVTVGSLEIGFAADVAVISSGSGFLNAWIDFNQDGDWGDPGEQVLTDQPVVAGTNVLLIDVPGATAGHTFARFRLTETAGTTYLGLAATGEVEDYQVEITDPDDPGGDPDLDPTLFADGVPENPMMASKSRAVVGTVGFSTSSLPATLIAVPTPTCTHFEDLPTLFAIGRKSRRGSE